MKIAIVVPEIWMELAIRCFTKYPMYLSDGKHYTSTMNERVIYKGTSLE